ncbi:MAG: peptide chain release factor-like protein [Planctomycetota bacterium]|nr:peptide chain release factor-like protein [Planctomycetota bacterium]
MPSGRPNPFRFAGKPPAPGARAPDAPPAREPPVLWRDPPHPATLDEETLLREITMDRQRSGGPGGQHRNKVETAVVFTHPGTGIIAQAAERRSVRENRPVALRRLRLALAMGVRCPVPDGDQRSALWRSRCDRAGRIACNPQHADFPALLAEALDMAWACGLDVARAAARLACTTSQLVRLVKDHPPAFAMLNEARRARGERALK